MAETAADIGAELLPADDEGIPAEDDVAAAEASALDEPVAVAGAPPEPLGRTWLFDYEKGRFVRDGLAPKEVRGFQGLAVWIEMARRSALGAHPVFTANFGFENPDDIIGQAAEVEEFISDWGERLRQALMVHDRIASLENFQAEYDASTGTVLIHRVDVVTDVEEEPLRIGELQIGTVPES